MNAGQDLLLKEEITAVAKLLATWPYLDANTRKLIAEYSEFRFPRLYRIIENVAKSGISIPKGDEYAFLSEVINQSCSDPMISTSLSMHLFVENTVVSRYLSTQQPPYNLVYVQGKLIQYLREYLSELYKVQNKTILDDLRLQFPELRDQTNEMMLLNKIYYLEVNDGPKNFGELALYAKNKYEQGLSSVISSGFVGIDQKINEGGYAPKRLTVLESKTGLGKTSFISQTLCDTALKLDKGVLLLSFEMDVESIMYRMLSQATQIPAKELVKMYESSDGPTPSVAEIAEQLDKNISIKYPDNSGDVGYIESEILDFIRVFGRVPALVVVDYIQQLSMGRGGRYSTLSDELTTISRTIRGFAQQYNTHVILTSQVMETSDGVARAFGASGIEFAADHVIVLGKSQTDENKRILKFKKNRFGPSGDEIELMWNAKITSFFEVNSYPYGNGISDDMLTTSSTYKENGINGF